MNEKFTNEQISFNEVPSLETIVFEPLHGKYKKVVAFRAVGILILLILASIVFYFFEIEGIGQKDKVVFCVFIPVIGILNCLLQWFGVNKKGYAVRTHDIIYKTGLINHKEIVIPYNRVQHIETYEGFLLRIFGLCQLEFFTAGGAFGDLRIPGLSKVEAEQIKAFVVSKVKPLEQKREYEETEEINFINE